MARGKSITENSEEELGAEWKPRPDENLGAYIHRVRLMRGLTLPDVARVTSQLPSNQRVSHPYLSQIEHGQVFQPARERLQSIAGVLGIPANWLLEKAGFTANGVREPVSVQRSPTVEMIALRAAQLDPPHQKMILEMVEAVLRTTSGEPKKGRG